MNEVFVPAAGPFLRSSGKISGAKFDQAHRADPVIDHPQEVAEFRKESKTAKDPEGRASQVKLCLLSKITFKQARCIAPHDSELSQARTATPQP